MEEYLVKRTETRTDKRTDKPTGAWTSLSGDWDGPVWREANVLEVGHFRPESSDHRPRTLVKALYDAEAIHVLFRVEDRYVRCVQTEYMSAVHTDSCVEFYVRPRPDRGYLNFVVNCGGALHCSYIEDWRRTPTGFEKYTPLPEELGRRVEVYHSMPPVVDPEVAEPVVWRVEISVPFSLLSRYVGPLGPDFRKDDWRANFYKCGEDTSHPHWAAWSPVDELNFHRPECFGVVRFGGCG